MSNREAYLREEEHDAVLGECLRGVVAEPRGEVAPGDVLHDNVEDAALDAGLMIADDIGVGETAQDLHLVARVGARVGVHPGELHLLHSHADVILATTREVHLAERPRADRLEKLVAVVEAVAEQARARGGARIGRGRRVVHRRALAVEVVVGGGEGAVVACTRRQLGGRVPVAGGTVVNRARGPVDAENGRRRPRARLPPRRVARRVGRRAGRARDSLAGQRHRHRPSLGEHFDQFLWDAATKTTPGFRVLISGDEEKRPGSARGSPQRSTRNHPGDDGVREFLFDSEFHTTSQSRKSVRIRGVLSSESRPLAGWRFFIRRESSRRSHVLLRVKASFWRLLLRPRPRAHRVVQE